MFGDKAAVAAAVAAARALEEGVVACSRPQPCGLDERNRTEYAYSSASEEENKGKKERERKILEWRLFGVLSPLAAL